MKRLEFEAIKSPIITCNNDLIEILKNLLKGRINDEDILLISSKVVALTEGKVVPIKNKEDFAHIVEKEADQVIGGETVTMTLKDNIFIAWAGIDRSNIEPGYAILWPKNPFQSAQKLLQKLKKHFKLKKLGIVITDSWCAPLRKGVTGIALAYAGFEGVEDVRGTKDLFGNTLKITQKAVADQLAQAAHLLMGEGNEAIPFVLAKNAPVRFTNRTIKKDEMIMPMKECLYAPLYDSLT